MEGELRLFGTSLLYGHAGDAQMNTKSLLVAK